MKPKASLVWNPENSFIITHLQQLCVLWVICLGCAHIIENGRPSLHGNTLEDGEHSKQNVVELRDAVVGPDPGVVAVVHLWTFPHSAGERQLWRVNSLIVYKKEEYRNC